MPEPIDTIDVVSPLQMNRAGNAVSLSIANFEPIDVKITAIYTNYPVTANPTSGLPSPNPLQSTRTAYGWRKQFKTAGGQWYDSDDNVAGMDDNSSPRVWPAFSPYPDSTYQVGEVVQIVPAVSDSDTSPGSNHDMEWMILGHAPNGLLTLTRLDTTTIGPNAPIFYGNQTRNNSPYADEVLLIPLSPSLDSFGLSTFNLNGIYLGDYSAGPDGQRGYYTVGVFQDYTSNTFSYGFVNGGEQYLGSSTKHFGALSLWNFGASLSPPTPHQIYSGLMPTATAGSNVITVANGLAVISNADSRNLLSVNLGHLQACTFTVSSSHTIGGYTGDGGGFGSFGTGVMEGPGYGQGSIIPCRFTGYFAATAARAYGSGFTGGNYGGQTTVSGGISSAGYIAGFGGNLAPTTNFMNVRQQYGEPGWIQARTQTVPQLSSYGQAPPLPHNPPFSLPPESSFAEYPPDPWGPLVFVNGLYVGGGMGLLMYSGGTAMPVSAGGTGQTTLISGELLYGNGTGPIQSAGNTRIVSGSLQLKLGTNRWGGFQLGSH